ncbi:uncharacterized protein DSM5745_06011 [Aspergillus mulundensis]|uniref:Uncharacterized protein n=1 Tax=Aspergillus mulundensis TaxID=1810919 RepID=A0A3D8RYM9_9EURO|nr:Uncharacterized protein DSM5745_06011 [Aspergillus mulundensis]RDW79159.1 Uncharacterized protein DSM5745_06011 [Aspergillus mulundensis]
MSPVEHNAWAQMKAKEREQCLSDPDKGKYSLVLPPMEPTPKPLTTRKTSGLDYDAELALPMPKPRHARPEEMPPTTSKPNVLSKPNVTKKRSTTEPTLSSDRSSKSESSEKKKKSKVATLRSKFSLKDIAKEYRSKETPPLSSMPKLGGSSGYGLQRTSSESEGQSKSPQTFNEPKLYAPKTRKGDVPPNSAPPHTTEFPDSSSMDKQSILSCPSSKALVSKGSDDGKIETTFKHSLVHNTDVGQSTPNTRLETMLLDGSSPPARAGECKNTGQPELIQVQDRVFSMKAENNQLTVPSSPKTPPPPPRCRDAAAYSPSVYDTPKEVGLKVPKSPLNGRNGTGNGKHPFIVSSSDFKNKAHVKQTDDQFFLEPRAPPTPPLPMKSPDRTVRRNQNNMTIDEAQYFAGVTSHGGYAPPPPHPGYQNTATLEQQLVTHVDSLHFHLTTVVNKLTRTFEDGNNWSADKILKQVDNVFDVARTVDGRFLTQANVMKDLQQGLMEARNQAFLARQETFLVEERMKAFVHQEVANLKNELRELIMSNTGTVKTPTQGQDSKADASHPGSQGGFKSAGGKRNQQVNKNKSRQTKLTDNKKSVAEHQESKPGAARQPGSHSPGDSVPTPTAAYRTPGPRTDGIASPVPTKREISEEAGEGSSGSPKLKAAKLHISGPIPNSDPQSAAEGSHGKGPESNQPSGPQRESDSNPRSVFNSDGLKTPKKKGSVFSFHRNRNGDNQSGSRFLRTPRRTKEGKPVGIQEPQGPGFALSTPTKAHVAPAPSSSIASTASSNATAIAIPQIQREESPSMIHPALRNAQQRHIMAERERLGLLNHQIPAPGQLQGHGHPLRLSHSHQSFGNRDSAATSASPHPSYLSYDEPTPYASAMSLATSSSTSYHDVRQYQSSMHYPHASSSSSLPHGQGTGFAQPQFLTPQLMHPHPALPGPGYPIGHSHGPIPIPNQLDGVGIEWFGDGNVPIAPGYPDGHGLFF